MSKKQTTESTMSKKQTTESKLDIILAAIGGKYSREVVECVLRHCNDDGDVAMGHLIGGIHVPTWLAKDDAMMRKSPQASRSTTRIPHTPRSEEEEEDEEEVASWNEGPPTQECAICFTDSPVTEMYTVNCVSAHRFCFDCIRKHAETKIRDGLLVGCPCPGCLHVIDPQELRQLGMGDELEALYDKHTLNRALEHVEGATGCPTPGCENWIVCASPGEAELVQCSGCQASFCSLCKEKYHFRISCSEARRAVGKWIAWNETGRRMHHGVRQEEEKKITKAREENERRNAELKERFQELVRDEKWKELNTRRCPHCQRVIEKIEGCDSMTCGRDHHGGNQQQGCGNTFRWTAALPYKADSAEPTIEEFVRPATSKDKSHGPYRCDACHKEMVGLRFTCIHCSVIDFCEDCEEVATSEHQRGHIFSIVM